MKPKIKAILMAMFFSVLLGCGKVENMYLVTLNAYNLNASESPTLVMWFAYTVDPPKFDSTHHTYYARGMVSEKNLSKAWIIYKLRPSSHDSIGLELDVIYDNTRTLHLKASEASPTGGTSVLHQELKISDAL